MKRLDLIIRAIDIAITQNSHDMVMTGEELHDCDQALAAARDLREMEPVGVCVEATRYSQNDVDWYSYTPDAGTKLYALGGEE